MDSSDDADCVWLRTQEAQVDVIVDALFESSEECDEHGADDNTVGKCVQEPGACSCTRSGQEDRTGKQEVDKSTATKRKKGGALNNSSYENKKECCSESSIHFFLQEVQCLCGKGCIKKIKNLGDQGLEIVRKLRNDRFASKWLQYP